MTWQAASRNSSTLTRCTGFSLACPVSQPMRNQPAGMRTSAGTYSSARDRERSKVGSVGSMVSTRPQRADDVFDLILLEKADAGNAGCSSIQTRFGILYCDAAESKNWDLRPADFAQGGEARRWRSGSAFFFEHRSEDGEVGFVGLGAEDISGRVAGGGHQGVVSGGVAGGRGVFRCHKEYE